MVGSSPQLVLYERGSNVNIITEEMVENKELEIVSARAGKIKVAGGDYVSTDFGTYKAVLGPSRSGEYYSLQCKGMKSIMGDLTEHPLEEINRELRDSELVDLDTPVPEYTDGGRVGLLVGLQDVRLDPVLFGTLPSGTGVYRCLFVDIWGSSIGCGGPIPRSDLPTWRNMDLY